jgi:Phosphotransferase enzyme family
MSEESPEERSGRIRTLDTVPVELNAGLPDDGALPALAVLQAEGLGAIPALGLDGRPAELILRGYTPGDRAAIEVRLSDPGVSRFAIKVYAGDPAPEAELYMALAGAGLASGNGVRVPRLLAWDAALKLVVLEWLEGLPLNDVVKEGPPERAGELGARWLRCAASLPVRLGPPHGPARVISESGRFIDMLEDGDPALGSAGRTVIESLSEHLPRESAPHLVHGTLYTRHLIDMEGHGVGGLGVIDWQRSGQGPLELDAGTFLATLSRTGLLRNRRVSDVDRAEKAFRAETSALLDERAVAWYEAAALLRLAGRMLRRRPPAKAVPLLEQAARLAAAAR